MRRTCWSIQMPCLSAIVAVLLALTAAVQGCIYEYGSRLEAGTKAGAHFAYTYNGMDWANDFPTCRGSRQSPVMLPGLGYAASTLKPTEARTQMQYGTLNNPTIVNNGHTVQMAIPADFESNVMVPFKGDKQTAKGTSIITGQGPVAGKVRATPAQLHFHAHGEHVISGVSYPLEMHIVHFIKKDQLPACGDAGCPAVVGVLFALTNQDSEVKPELRKLIESMPQRELESRSISGSINLNALLPQNQTYWTYEGSLTTPPCTEGILWHVLAQPLKITPALLEIYQQAVGDTFCDEKAAAAAKNNRADEQLPVSGAANGQNVLKERAAAPSGDQMFFQLPPMDAQGCRKRGNGNNFRVMQPTNGRPIKLAVAF